MMYTVEINWTKQYREELVFLHLLLQPSLGDATEPMQMVDPRNIRKLQVRKLLKGLSPENRERVPHESWKTQTGTLRYILQDIGLAHKKERKKEKRERKKGKLSKWKWILKLLIFHLLLCKSKHVIFLKIRNKIISQSLTYILHLFIICASLLHF